MPSPGQLRERVQFQQRTPDKNDDLRGPWDPDGLKVWAAVVPLKGSEPVLQQRLLGIQPLAVTIRYSAAAAQITSAWRMVWQGRPYNIKAPPAADTARRWLSILAEADQTSV
jgi:SPP1 family predicted phage head-tail adaptor